MIAASVPDVPEQQHLASCTGSPRRIVLLFQLAPVSVEETTYFGIPFIR